MRRAQGYLVPDECCLLGSLPERTKENQREPERERTREREKRRETVACTQVNGVPYELVDRFRLEGTMTSGRGY